MIRPETCVQIRRYFYAEHWKIGTIALQLGLHADTVRQAIEVESFHRTVQLRSSILDPYLEFLPSTTAVATVQPKVATGSSSC